MLDEIKAALFLMIALVMLVFICALASLGAFIQPNRWSDRKEYQ